jgi:hypothetical protein
MIDALRTIPAGVQISWKQSHALRNELSVKPAVQTDHNGW